MPRRNSGINRARRIAVVADVRLAGRKQATLGDFGRLPAGMFTVSPLMVTDR